MTLAQAQKEILQWCRTNDFVEVDSFSEWNINPKNQYINHSGSEEMNFEIRVVVDDNPMNHFCIFDFYEGFVICQNYDIIRGNTTPIRNRELDDQYIRRIKRIMMALNPNFTVFPDIDIVEPNTDNGYLQDIRRFFDRIIGCNLASVYYSDSEEALFDMSITRECFVRVNYKSPDKKGKRNDNMPEDKLLELRKMEYDGNCVLFLSTGEYRAKKIGNFNLNRTLIGSKRAFEEAINEIINFLHKTEDEEFKYLGDKFKEALA